MKKVFLNDILNNTCAKCVYLINSDDLAYIKNTGQWLKRRENGPFSCLKYDFNIYSANKDLFKNNPCGKFKKVLLYKKLKKVSM